jgi:hypothetical protein
LLTSSSSVLIAGLAVFLILGFRNATTDRAVATGDWLAPFLLGLFFLAWSLYAIATEGPFGFLGQHMSDAWGIQIALDLLSAAGIAFFALVPRLRAARMNPLPWFVVICLTGSVALYAMLAHLLYREARQER